MYDNQKVAFITGASSGIGAASAKLFAKEGYQLALGARRDERLQEVVSEIERETGIRPFNRQLDVCDNASCESYVNEMLAHFGHVDVLLNNAGLAKGLRPIHETDVENDWREMVETNVMGLLRITRLVAHHMERSRNGHIINIGSIAWREAYAGGAVYCGTKFAVRAITEAMRQELLGLPIRVTTVDPGMVETEFSIVRFDGDRDRADQIYEGVTPLTPQDIAECIYFAASRLKHVNIDAIVVKPLDQAGAGKVARHYGNIDK